VVVEREQSARRFLLLGQLTLKMTVAICPTNRRTPEASG
jgi:hypothetical protein